MGYIKTSEMLINRAFAAFCIWSQKMTLTNRYIHTRSIGQCLRGFGSDHPCIPCHRQRAVSCKGVSGFSRDGIGGRLVLKISAKYKRGRLYIYLYIITIPYYTKIMIDKDYYKYNKILKVLYVLWIVVYVLLLVFIIIGLVVGV